MRSCVIALSALSLFACQGFERAASPGDARPSLDYDDGSAGSDGACAPCAPRVLASGLVHADFLAVDDTYVYWAEHGTWELYGSINRVDKGGCAEGARCGEPLVQELYAVTGFALDGGRIYWSERFESQELRFTGSVSSLTLASNELAVLMEEQDQPLGLAFHQGRLFWGTQNELVALDTAARTPTLEVLHDNLPRPVATVISEGRIFFTTEGDGAVNPYVASMRLDGTDLRIIATNQAEPGDLAVGPAYVYWTDLYRGVVMRAPLSGEAEARPFLANLQRPSRLLIDDGVIYVTEEGKAPTYEGCVLSVHLDGTERMTLAEGQPRPTALAIDGDALYWVNYGKEPGLDSAVMRLSLSR